MARWLFAGILLSCLVLNAAAARAQSSSTGAIGGVVRDTTGAVLPGITVEAASPALIEKVRTGVTDDQGNYKIVDLRPGTYTVTFTLPGFSTVKREGLELTAGFTATVNAEMRVGGVEETITVTGASPIVDVQNVRSQQVISAQQLNELPSSRNFMALSAMTLGVTGGGGGTAAPAGNRDVGGNNSDGTGGMAIHGSRPDGASNIDGVKNNSLSVEGARRRYNPNPLAIQENVVETGGMSAETETGGVSVNSILREGGNTFRGFADGDYTGSGLQATNLSDDLRARGLTASNRTRLVYSAGAGIGGPIRKDRVWFHTTFRAWGNKEEFAGSYYNKPELRNTRFYEPDLSNPGYISPYTRDSTTRLTWQAASKHKISAIASLQSSCSCHSGTITTQAPETWRDVKIGPQRGVQANWSYPRTNKLLFESGFAMRLSPVEFARQPGTTASDISMRELSTGFTYNAELFAPGPQGFGYYGRSDQYNTAGAMSYVTGSHALKVGWQTLSGNNPAFGQGNEPPIQYQFRNGIPSAIRQVASPGGFWSEVDLNMGIYAQEQWTVKRLTLNMGVRYDTLIASNPASVRPAGMFLGEIRFDEVKDVPNWRDVSPRLGAAYDLFGTGRTAVKVSLGRYVVMESLNVATATNPSAALAADVTRTWNDSTFPVGDPRRGNFVPDCTLTNNAANGECGAVSSSTFGTPVFNLRYDPNFRTGFAVRPYNWQTGAVVQHELGNGIGLTAGYFRTWYGNITVTDNQAIVPADYDTYCITAPSDSRLGSVSGSQICGLYDIKPEKFGLTNNLVRVEEGRTEVFNGVDVGLRARFGNGGLLNGGVSLGQTTVDNCTFFDSPDARFCKNDNPAHQFKVNAMYPLRWGIKASAVYQNLPGTNQTAALVVPNAQIASSLGRNLGSCRGAAVCNGTANVVLFAPNEVREKRASQLDVGVSKTFPLSDASSFRVGFDVYNLLNSNDVLASNGTYGPNWLRPGNILAARLYKFNARFEF